MMKDLEPPMNWSNAEDIATGLYERFGDDFTDVKIETASSSNLAAWVQELHNFAGEPGTATEQHLNLIRNAWIEEWRNNQKPSDSHLN